MLLTLGNGPQLLDFNLAHDPHSADQARAALRGGTLPYMAPEQLDAYLDPERWDSVGAAAELYFFDSDDEMLTGQPPEVPDQKLPPLGPSASCSTAGPNLGSPPRQLNPSVPNALEGIVARCSMLRPKTAIPTQMPWPMTSTDSSRRRPLRYASNLGPE